MSHPPGRPPTPRRAAARLTAALAALAAALVIVPLLTTPLSTAMKPECAPPPTTDHPSGEAAGPTTDQQPTPTRALGDADLFAPPAEDAPNAAVGLDDADLFGAPPTDDTPPAAAPLDDAGLFGAPPADDAAPAPCPGALPADLPTPRGLTTAALLSLLVGLITALVATLVGATLGLLSGYRGGLAERVVVHGFANGLDALPQFVLLVTAVALYRDLAGTEDDTRLLVMGALIGLVNSTGVLLVVHHQTRLLTTRKFVVAARLMGWPAGRVIRHKILPHLRHELIIPFTQLVIWGVFMETALSYLGFSPSATHRTLGTELYRLEPFIDPVDLGPVIVMCLLTVLIAVLLRVIGDAIEALSHARDAARLTAGATR